MGITSCTSDGLPNNKTVAADPDSLIGKNTYVNPADGITYSTDGEFVEYSPEDGIKKLNGSVQPSGLVLLTDQYELENIIDINYFIEIIKGIDAIVVDELASVKEQGKVVLQINLYTDRVTEIHLACEGVNSDDLGGVYKTVEKYCKDIKTKRDSCIFQNIYILNSYGGGTNK